MVKTLRGAVDGVVVTSLVGEPVDMTKLKGVRVVRAIKHGAGVVVYLPPPHEEIRFATAADYDRSIEKNVAKRPQA